MPAPSPTSDPPAQLVQLRQTETVRTPDDHRIGARHVEPGLDDIGRQQNVALSRGELHHRFVQFGPRQLAMHFDEREIGGEALQPFSHVGEIGNARNDDEALALAQLFPSQRKADRRVVDVADGRADGLSARGRRRDHGHLLQADHGPVQRARDGRRAHHQQVHVGRTAQLGLVGGAEALLFVDHHESELRVPDRLAHDRRRADHDADRSVGQSGQHGFLFRRARQPRQTGDRDARVGEPARELFEMLTRQNGRGRCDDHLISREGNDGRRPQGHFGLAITDIADDQSLHRLARREVFAHRGDGPRLIGRFVVGKAGDEAFVGRRLGFHRGGGQLGALLRQSDERRRGLGNRLVDFGASLVPARAIQLVALHALGIAAIAPQESRVAHRHQSPRFSRIFQRDYLSPVLARRGFETDDTGKAMILVDHEVTGAHFHADEPDLARGGHTRVDHRPGSENVGGGDEGEPVVPRAAIKRRAQKYKRAVGFRLHGAQAFAILRDRESIAQSGSQEPQVAFAADNHDASSCFSFGLQEPPRRARGGFRFGEARDVLQIFGSIRAFFPPVASRGLPSLVVYRVERGSGVLRGAPRKLGKAPAPFFGAGRPQDDAGRHVIEQGRRCLSVGFGRAADLDRLAGFGAQLRDSVEMMDRGDAAVFHGDPYGSAGVGGIEIDDFATYGDLARLVDAVVGKIAECDRLFEESVGIDRIAHPDGRRFRIKGFRRKVAARGGFARRHHDQIAAFAIACDLSQAAQGGDAMADIGRRGGGIVSGKRIARREMDDGRVRQQACEPPGKPLGLGIVVAKIEDRTIAEALQDAEHLGSHAARHGIRVIGLGQVQPTFSYRGRAQEK